MHDKLNYIHSCDLNVCLPLKIGTLEGKPPKPDYEDLLENPLLEFSGRWQDQCSDIYVEVRVVSDEEELSLPVTTSYKAFTTRWNWNEWLTLPVRFCDLPMNARICFRLYEPFGPQAKADIGSASIAVFTPEGYLNEGMHDLKLSAATDDSDAVTLTTSTTGVKPDDSAASSAGSDQMERLSRLTRKHRNGQLQQVDWLDRLTFREIEVINECEKRTSSSLYLMIEFPKIVENDNEVTLVFYDQGADSEDTLTSATNLVGIIDDELCLDNLLELKHHHLARSVRSGLTDRDLKPDAPTRDLLGALVSAPPTLPASREGQDMMWKYRFYLSTQNKALSKFLKCVNWEQESESQQALDLMFRWAPIDPHQALELLGPSFSHPSVRSYAVSRLQQAPDEELLMYLLQLVQALRYECEDSIYADLELSPVQSRKPPSLTITSIGSQSSQSSLMSESPTAMESSGKSVDDDVTLSDDVTEATLSLQRVVTPPPTPVVPDPFCDLSTFLIHRACQNSVVANYFYWFMLVECEEADDLVKQDMRVRKIYLAVMKRFSQALKRGGPHCLAKKDVLARQQNFIDRLVKLFKTVVKESGNRRKKIEKMQALLADPDAFKFNFVSFDPLPLPLDPEIRICGIIPQKTTLFKSALMPARLTFRTEDESEYLAIFKYGDDLRQDQLILQIIMLMDKLLRRENLDLKLTPYKVLATNTKHGFVQFIDSLAVAEVLNQEGSILNYFRRLHPSETGPYGVSSDVMDTYLRSCAGYCVITYVLGVGDRHLDNLLLTTSGHLFHVDFGYILGRDPKPLPPPMKLSKEMVEAMGGVNSEHYQQFRKQCYTAFLHLRRHASVILHLFSLMVDANIPDIALEPDKTVRKVQDKFRLDLSDEEAVAYMQSLIDVSVTAVMAALVEQLHKFAQYWRK